MYTAYIERQKWLPLQLPLVAGYLQYLHSVGQPFKPSSIISCLVAIVHTKPVIAILVPELVAIAMTLRHSISAMSSSDSLTPKTHPWNQTVCSLLSYNQSYSPSKAKNWLLWQRPLAPVDPHLTHDCLGPSEPTTQAASRSVQPSLHRWP